TAYHRHRHPSLRGADATRAKSRHSASAHARTRLRDGASRRHRARSEDRRHAVVATSCRDRELRWYRQAIRRQELVESVTACCPAFAWESYFPSEVLCKAQRKASDRIRISGADLPRARRRGSNTSSCFSIWSSSSQLPRFRTF